MNNPTVDTFKVAQDHIFTLMYHDCFPRFIKSKHYKQLLKRHWPRINATLTTSSPTSLVSSNIESSAPFYIPDACSHETHAGSHTFNSSYCAVIDNTLTTLYAVHRFSMRNLSWIKTVSARFIGSSKVKKVIWLGSFGLHLMCSLTSYVIWKRGTFLWKLPDPTFIYC